TGKTPPDAYWRQPQDGGVRSSGYGESDKDLRQRCRTSRGSRPIQGARAIPDGRPSGAESRSDRGSGGRMQTFHPLYSNRRKTNNGWLRRTQRCGVAGGGGTVHEKRRVKLKRLDTREHGTVCKCIADDVRLGEGLT